MNYHKLQIKCSIVIIYLVIHTCNFTFFCSQSCCCTATLSTALWILFSCIENCVFISRICLKTSASVSGSFDFFWDCSYCERIVCKFKYESVVEGILVWWSTPSSSTWLPPNSTMVIWVPKSYGKTGNWTMILAQFMSAIESTTSL